MKSTITTAFLLLLAFFQKAQACDCFPVPTFCETITFSNNGQIWDYLNIYHVKVDANLPNGLKVTISKTYFGEDMTGHQVFIQDGNGANCVLFASSNLDANQEYIIAAQIENDTLSVSECGVTFLKIENGKVQGAIAPGITEVAVEEFPNAANCGDLSPSAVVTPSALGGIVVRPTLAQNSLELSTNFTEITDIKLTVFDAFGRKVCEANYPRFSASSKVEVDLTNWSNGVYFLHLEANGAGFTQKIVKFGND